MKSAILVAAVLACSHVSMGSGTTVSKPVVVKADKANPPGFAFLRGHRQGRGVTVTWGMTNCTGINSFDIECTYEDPTDPYSVWEVKGNINCNNLRSFNFMDNQVFPGIMHYRIVARTNNGNIVSDYETVRYRGH